MKRRRYAWRGRFFLLTSKTSLSRRRRFRRSPDDRASQILKRSFLAATCVVLLLALVMAATSSGTSVGRWQRVKGEGFLRRLHSHGHQCDRTPPKGARRSLRWIGLAAAAVHELVAGVGGRELAAETLQQLASTHSHATVAALLDRAETPGPPFRGCNRFFRGELAG